MTLRVVYRREARREFDDAVDWYEHQRPGLGERFIDAVHHVIVRISQDPELHAMVYQNARKANVPGYPYAVYYQVEADSLVVLSVFHAKRNPQIWKDRIR